MLTLVSNCIDRLNVYNSAAHFGECAGSEAGAAWKDILNLLYELLGKTLLPHTRANARLNRPATAINHRDECCCLKMKQLQLWRFSGDEEPCWPFRDASWWRIEF